MFDNQSNCRGGGTPNKLCYEAAQHLSNISIFSRCPGYELAHQSIRDKHEPALDLKEQAGSKILNPSVSGWEHLLQLTEIEAEICLDLQEMLVSVA